MGKNKFNINKKILGALILLIILIVLLIFLFKNREYTNVYYRVYTKENGWSTWCKNEEICGNDNNITAYQVKIKSKVKGNVFYESYQKGKWTDTKIDNEVSGNKKDNIKSIRLQLSGRKLRKTYNLYYRFMSGGLWSEWESDYTFKEIKDDDRPINKIQIKIKGV